MPPQFSQYTQWFSDEVLPHSEALRGYLKARFPGIGDHEDLLQESYVRLLQAKAHGPVACPRALLFVTARNIALNQIRKRRHEETQPSAAIEALMDQGEQVPRTIENAEAHRILLDAIAALPPRCRQIITLRKVYGLPLKEVAARLGLSTATIETQSAIGLRKCTEYLKRHGLSYP